PVDNGRRLRSHEAYVCTQNPPALRSARYTSGCFVYHSRDNCFNRSGSPQPADVVDCQRLDTSCAICETRHHLRQGSVVSEYAFSNADASTRAGKIRINCPICDAQQFSITYEPWADENDPAKLYGAASGIPGTQRLVTCDRCGLLYENPRFPSEIIIQGYM